MLKCKTLTNVDNPAPRIAARSSNSDRYQPHSMVKSLLLSRQCFLQPGYNCLALHSPPTSYGSCVYLPFLLAPALYHIIPIGSCLSLVRPQRFSSYCCHAKNCNGEVGIAFAYGFCKKGYWAGDLLTVIRKFSDIDILDWLKNQRCTIHVHDFTLKYQ